MSKYGEPWFKACGTGGEAQVLKHSLELVTTLAPTNGKHEEATRIVQCVNACDGLEDPEKEIADLRAQSTSLLSQLASLHALLVTIRIAAGDINGRLTPDELVEHIAELVRAFNAGVHLYLELGGEAESKEVAKALQCSQETVRRLWGLWPDTNTSQGDPASARESETT